MLKLLSLRSYAVSLPAALLLLCPTLHAQNPVTLSGFVTFAGTPTEFRVNERPVTCVPGSTVQRVVAKRTIEQAACPQHFVGESVTVEGRQDKAAGSITARRVESEATADERVQGFAVVGRVLTPLHEGVLVVRADGYPVRIDAATHVTLDPEGGLKTLADIETNVWLRFSGVLQQDGLVHASEVTFQANEVAKTENKLKQKTEFDAASVKEEDRQGGISKFFTGWDPKRVPAYHDEAMEARLQGLGERLIPAYQRGLKDDDPTKITFRFQLVDQPKMAGCFALPSGIILVPYQVVARLEDDSELAAILATEIAGVIDKQALRGLPAAHARGAANIAGAAAGFLIPGAGIATGLATMKGASVQNRHQAEQRSREGLALMQDAGFDVAKAPVAWWRLYAKDPQVLVGVTMPERATYTYQVLAMLYRPAAAAQQAEGALGKAK